MKPLTELLLPVAQWLNSPALKRVVAALTDGENIPRLVGGAVRDCLLGLAVADIDLATPIHPKDVMKRLEQSGIKAVPTGIDHGTVTAVAGGQNFEITTLRRDVSTDGRRATIAFSDDWREDAARRDFTINALYADPVSREIFDYFGGLQDLQSHHLRFIGNAAERIAEDHLRILRYFRFLARFGVAQVDAEAIAACGGAANNLMALSRERIASELMKILTTADPTFAVTLMIEGGIFVPFLPELDGEALAKLAKLVAREREFGVAATPSARLLAILPTDPFTVDKIAMRLKLSNRMRSELATLLRWTSPPTPENIRSFAYFSNRNAAYDAALLFSSDTVVSECIARLTNWEVPDFAFKGGELIQRGLAAGPIVAITLQTIEKKWVEADFPNGDHFAALVDQEIAAALSAAKKV
jgi:poly(A) polymerase